MHRDTTNATANPRSPFLAAFGAILAGLYVFVWVQTGQLSSLMAAFAFAAIAPVWYLLPISFAAPIQGPWKGRRIPTLPKWAVVLSVAGGVCLFASVWLRWARDL